MQCGEVYASYNNRGPEKWKNGVQHKGVPAWDANTWFTGLVLVITPSL